MKPVVIASYVRSPFTFANKGGLKKVRPDDLAAQTIRGLIETSGVNPADVEDLILGCAFPEGEQGLNMARLVGLLADLPLGVTGVTVNRFCGSSMQSIHMAAGAIQMNAGDAFICAGVESMTRVPMMGFNPLPNPGLHARMPEAYVSMGQTAENLATSYQITRDEQDQFAAASHAKAAKAAAEGLFDDEIIAIETPEGRIERDGCIRPGTSVDDLKGLKPAFDETGSVTAGSSSPLTDGASATLVCTEDYAAKHGLEPLARIKAIATSGCRPEIMGIGPVESTWKALARGGIELGDVGVIELNEAFAAQSIACIRELDLDQDKINIDGGAIALGHPLGATGARITGKAAALLHREDADYALAAQCIGGGQGIATLLEAV